MTKGINNKNRQSNIKLPIINTQIVTKKISIVIDIVKVIAWCRLCVLQDNFEIHLNMEMIKKSKYLLIVI